jgi:hypothetical protein
MLSCPLSGGNDLLPDHRQ